MFRTRIVALTLLFVILALTLAACADEGSASKAVEDYLKAKISGDTDKAVNLACKDWEIDAVKAATAFKSVDAAFEGMSCKDAGTDDSFTLVTCEGTLSYEYDGELNAIDLSSISYRAIKENGEWKMCGEEE